MERTCISGFVRPWKVCIGSSYQNPSESQSNSASLMSSSARVVLVGRETCNGYLSCRARQEQLQRLKEFFYLSARSGKEARKLLEMHRRLSDMTIVKILTVVQG